MLEAETIFDSTHVKIHIVASKESGKSERVKEREAERERGKGKRENERNRERMRVRESYMLARRIDVFANVRRVAATP